MAIIRKIPWHKQPTYPVDIDYGSELGSRVRAMYLLPHTRDVKNKTLIDAGIIVRNSWFTNAAGLHAGTRDDLLEGNCSILVHLRTGTTLLGNEVVLGKRDSFSVSGMRWQLAFSVATMAWNTAGDAAVGFNEWVAVVNTEYVFCMVDNGTTSTLYVDGVKIQTVSGTLAFDDATDAIINIGCTESVTSETFHGFFHSITLFDALTESQARSLTRNPYQVLQPRTQIIPIEVAAPSAASELSLMMTGIGT